MKKIYYVFAVVLFVAVAWALQDIAPIDREGKRVDPGQLHTPTIRWTTIDTTSSTSAEPADIDFSTRASGGDVTYQQVKTLIAAAGSGDDKISVFDIPRSWNGIRLRATGIANGGTATYQIYAGTLGDGNRDVDSTTADCELAYVGQFAFIIGQQLSATASYNMADTLVVTSSDWTKTVTVTNPGGDRVAEGRFDLMGADIIIAVPSTVSDDCKLLAKGF